MSASFTIDRARFGGSLLTSGTVKEIQSLHGPALGVLLDALAVARHHRMRPAGSQPLRLPGLPRLGPLISVESGHTNLTVVTEWVEAGWFTQEPGPHKTCVSIAIAGHNRKTGIRAQLLLEECDAWMSAILDNDWLQNVYRRIEPAARAGHVHLASYKVFLNEKLSPTPKPDEQNLASYVPLNDSHLGGAPPRGGEPSPEQSPSRH